MRKYFAIGAGIVILSLQSCQPSFPEKVPDDFKIEYTLDGGMVNTGRGITIQNGICIDEGRNEGVEYKYEWKIEEVKELETLYAELKKLNAFSLKSKNGGEVYDRGGESIRYTINGKSFIVSNSQSNFIYKVHAEAFNKSIALILTFAELHRKPVIVNGESDDIDSNSTIIEKTNNTETVSVNKPSMSASVVGGDKSEESDAFTGIPPKMSNDFKIKYEMSAGISGAYRVIQLQYGSCSDEGKKAGEAKFSDSWINKDINAYQSLYADLYKINAFTLGYTTKGNTADRGGETLEFTINKTIYTVSDKDNNYIKPGDKNNFKKAVALILAFTDSSK